MASVTADISIRKDSLPADSKSDWMLANPWLWLAAACALTAWSWVWTWVYGWNASDSRVVVLALGLLCGGVGAWLRWNDRRAVYLPAWQAPFALFLGVFFALAFVTVTGIFLISFVDLDSLGLRLPFVRRFAVWLGGPLHTAPLFLVWISAAPPTFFAARRCLKRTSESLPSGPAHAEANRGDAVEQEISFAFIVAAALCIVGSFTLYADPSIPTDWDTLRMFLRVVTAVALYASVLALVSKMVRRIMLSLLFLIHFAGINTAALSAPPSPWIVQQIWMRVFRPYLEFAYLNNAYHYYAPEPGPASYVWFRIIYEDPTKRKEEGVWYKIPQLDENGRNLHPVALDYQRVLALTEGIAQAGPTPLEKVVNFKTGKLEDNPFWINRQKLGNEAADKVGQAQSSHVRIPYHPFLLYQQQVRVPSDHAKRLLESYARFVARKFPVHPDPEKSDWNFKSVKLYQVVHWIPKVEWFVNEIPATDPDLYYPFYLGNFDSDGVMYNNPSDPYLYWLLPSIRKDLEDPDSEIHDYAREHAGDPQFIRRGSDKRWVTPAERDK